MADPSGLGLFKVLQLLTLRIEYVVKHITMSWTWTDYLEQCRKAKVIRDSSHRISKI